MKHEQVVPDYILMLESSITVLALVGCGWLFFKLVSACIWFPQYMKNLEIATELANKHLEETLLPKKPIYSEKDSEAKAQANDGLEPNVKERKKTKMLCEKLVTDSDVPEISTQDKKEK